MFDDKRIIPASPPAATAAAASKAAPAATAPTSATATATAVTFDPRPARRTLEDLVVPAAVADRIRLALLRMEHHEVLYREWNLQQNDPTRTGTAANFYGPPGTGKTMAAEAVAHRLGRPVIEVDYAQIESKYVGETPKNIVACFAAAEQSGAVIVFNEADSLLGARLSAVTQGSDTAVNVARAVMLTQLDNFQGLVVFTTNFPRNYDSAFVRRIAVHVEFDLPDRPTLERLWAALVPAEVPGSAGLDPVKLAAASDGLAGGDIRTVVENACVRAVARSGAERVLRGDDLLAEIEVVRKAKEDVGRAAEPKGFQSRIVEQRVVDPQDGDRVAGPPDGDWPEDGDGAPPALRSPRPSSTDRLPEPGPDSPPSAAG